MTGQWPLLFGALHDRAVATPLRGPACQGSGHSSSGPCMTGQWPFIFGARHVRTVATAPPHFTIRDCRIFEFQNHKYISK